MQTVKAECEICGGTGLYRGMCEGLGVAVVCLNCDGTGCQEIRYRPFVKRKLRKDVKHVHLSRGTFVAGPVGPAQDSVTYKEFLEGKLPSAKKG